jgi:LysM repeat protein
MPSPSPTPGTAEPLATTQATGTTTPLPAATGCTPPAGWTLYTVRPGDSLFRLGQRYGVPYPELQAANCMGTTKQIYVGQRLYVPDPSPTVTAEPADPLPAETPSFSPWQIDS